VIDPGNPSVLYLNAGRTDGCIFSDDLVFKSTDGGTSWTNSISPPQSGCLLAGYITFPPSPVMVLASGSSQVLYLAEGDYEDGNFALLKSIDAGANWTGIWDFSSGLQSGLNTMLADPANPTTLYAGVGDGFSFGGVFKSTDGGANWANQGLRDSAVTVLAMDPADSNTLYAATAGINTAPRGFRGIYKTIDGGETWLLANNGLDRLTQIGVIIVSIAMDPIRPGTAYAATNGDGVYITSDGGATWTPWNEGLGSLDVRALALAEDGLYAATASGVFKAATN
jgi:photosystem II stability/assembly factor-like uncharacterized protein